MVVAFVVCLVSSGTIRKTLRSQQAAAAWAGQSGERFAQISAFIPTGSAFDHIAIYNLHSSLDRALVDASVEAPEGGSLYRDAWSALGEVSVIGERGSASVQVLGVGGDFFLFHPLYLRDGGYISENDLMKDRVVLDEELAWRLFGAVHLAGLEVMIGGKPYIIAGVVSREDDSASLRSYTGGDGMFMSYETLNEISGGADVICYEIVMPNPISGFAYNTITTLFPEKDAVFVENSARYSLLSIFRVIGAYGERSIQSDGIAFPYWENAARYTEDWLALLLVLSLAFIVFPAVCGVIYSVKGIRWLIKHGKQVFAEKVDKLDDLHAEEYRLTGKAPARGRWTMISRRGKRSL